MTRLSLIVVVTLMTIFSCSTKNENNNNCEQFKNGKFVFHLHGLKSEDDILFSIERLDSIQTETDKKTGNYTKLRVRWTDKCRYETIVLESTYPFSDSVQNIRKTLPLKTEIISFTKEYYVFKSHRDSLYTMTDTMWVIK